MSVCFVLSVGGPTHPPFFGVSPRTPECFGQDDGDALC